MARRYGGGGGGGATATITSLQRCGERNVACIKGLAKYAPRDLLDALGEEEYNNISKDIRELSKDAAVIKYESAIADMQCRNLTENEINADETDEQVIKRIKTHIEEQMAAYDGTDSEIYSTVDGLLKPKYKQLKAGDGDDIEIVEKELTEKDFNCPYTTMRFDTPMKNENCTHRISKAGLDMILQGKRNTRCVQPGCSAMWSRSTSAEDVEFALEMERFFRQKALQSQASSQSSNRHR